ncbi:MAG: hypothetical protein ABJO27_21845 [Pseudoruegeria sp.]
MNLDLLRDDCSRCAALCCIALAFDKSNAFAFDKPAGEPCRHLNKSLGCKIHADLTQSGFLGCTMFTCHGAGQRVIQDCFNGRSWRTDPHLLPRIMKAFKTARDIHDLMFLLSEAQKLPISAAQQETLKGYQVLLSPERSMTETWLEGLDTIDLKVQIHGFLRTLAPAARSLKS